ncbi:MAG: exonuclease domain-containing protein, partial [Myxococcota bacterium]
MWRHRVSNWWRRRQVRPENLPDWGVGYLNRYDPPSGSTPIEEVRLVVFDTETTGLDIERSQLLTLGAVAVTGGTICLQDSFEQAICRAEIAPASVRIHGLVPQDLRRGSSEEEAVAAFVEFVGSGVLVAHHAAFDVAMLERAMAGVPLLNYALDTEVLARRLE